MPVYCATKAAQQSFSKSLRYQLKETNVKVFDVAPPLVETELHEKVGAKSSQPKGILPEQVAKKTLQAIRKDNYEIAIGLARVLRIASKIAPNQMFKIINQKASGE